MSEETRFIILVAIVFVFLLMLEITKGA